jgi:hypothetical protein
MVNDETLKELMRIAQCLSDNVDLAGDQIGNVAGAISRSNDKVADALYALASNVKTGEQKKSDIIYCTGPTPDGSLLPPTPARIYADRSDIQCVRHYKGKCQKTGSLNDYSGIAGDCPFSIRK